MNVSMLYAARLTVGQMKTCVEYPGAAFQAALTLAKYHWLVRPIAACLIPEMKRLRGLIRIVDGFLRPIHQVG